MNSSLTSLIKSVWSRCSFAEYDTFGFGDIHESPPVFVDDFPNCCSLRSKDLCSQDRIQDQRGSPWLQWFLPYNRRRHRQLQTPIRLWEP
ncbi:hypothetical protein Forpi1262_v009161 [Fusarium oxysporum f. sp. raphani]|uniref:Uncharacterized protein n=1 Tax=Fusarium oxysporum f. sp. raphani TaxID=96318 RepID=A0A8J5PX12_FUSOX|nr:hypothetical protein Forpi1262_v009161 [Fusarium oxysporum f. sp. raphani]